MILTSEPGAESWPIAGATFILIHKQPQDPANAAEPLKFFAWAYKNGDKMAVLISFGVPMNMSLSGRPSEILDQREEPVREQARDEINLASTHAAVE